MVDEDVSYEVKTVQTMRGTEVRSIAKWQRAGWELVDQNTGILRTTLNFRRMKPKLPLFALAMAGGALALIAAIIGIGAALESGSGAVTDQRRPCPRARRPSWQANRP